MYFLSAATAIVTVCVAGGPLFILAASILGVVYYNGELTGRSAPFMLVNCLLYSGEGKEYMLYSKSIELNNIRTGLRPNIQGYAQTRYDIDSFERIKTPDTFQILSIGHHYIQSMEKPSRE